MKLPYIAIIDGDADFWIAQSDHDAIRDYLFKFKPDWMPKAEGKHTRGPWRMCGELRGSGCLCGQIWEAGNGADSKHVATCHGPHWSAKSEDVPTPDMDEQKANMKLIAAAPQLLDACQTGGVLAEFCGLWVGQKHNDLQNAFGGHHARWSSKTKRVSGAKRQ